MLILSSPIICNVVKSRSLKCPFIGEDATEDEVEMLKMYLREIVYEDIKWMGFMPNGKL